MTGRLSKLLPPPALIRLAVLPLLALVALLVTGDSASAAPACKCFNPNPFIDNNADGVPDVIYTTYSTTDPGSHPDIAGQFHIGLGPDGQPLTPDDTGDYNFGGNLTLSPSAPADAEVADGAIVGSLTSIAVLGLLNNPCTNRVNVAFTLPPLASVIWG